MELELEIFDEMAKRNRLLDKRGVGRRRENVLGGLSDAQAIIRKACKQYRKQRRENRLRNACSWAFIVFMITVSLAALLTP